MKATVALPIWNAQKIAWLCLESLKRQLYVDFEWELVVFEEIHENQLGMDYFLDNGPEDVAIKYVTDKKRHTLGEKWHRIMQESHPESKVLILCAADNYYHPHTLSDSLRAIESGIDWFYTTKGYFYDFHSERIIFYNAVRETGLQMAASMDIARNIPNSPRKRIVDLWLVRNMKPKHPMVDTSDHWKGTLWTHGYNQISTKRGQYFEHVKYPFRSAFISLEEIVPWDIAERIRAMS